MSKPGIIEPKLGFVGCGTHATNNLYPALAYTRGRLTAVCDLDSALAERNARLYGATTAFTDASRMLDECKLDGVLVVGPPDVHVAVGKQVLRRGIPLFVEKPMAGSLGQAEELVETAEANGTFVMVGYMKRFGLPYARAKSMIASGEFSPSAGFIKYSHWPNSDLNSMLLGMSIHAIDLAIHLFGDVAGVAPTLSRNDRGGISLALTLTFTSGKWCQLMLDSSQPRIQEHVEISGTMDGDSALIVVDNVQHMELHRQRMLGIDVLAPTLADITPDFDMADIQIWRPDYAIPNMGQHRLMFQGYIGEAREFVDAIRESRVPSAGNRDALPAMQVIQQVLDIAN